jgi:hypothetical protein
VYTLDLRLAITPFSAGHAPVEIVIDALNLIESDVADIDRALYLVDPNGSLTFDPGAGEVTIPLVVNGRFGGPVIRRTPGRVLRIGVRINYE